MTTQSSANITNGFLRQTYADNPSSVGLVDPKYAFSVPDRSTLGSKPLENRVRQRIFIGALALPYLLRAAGQQPGPWAPLKMSESVKKVVEGTTWKDEPTFQKRMLKPSMPVIHLAASFHLLHGLELRGGREIAITDLLTDHDLFAFVVDIAEQFEPFVSIWRPSAFDHTAQFRVRRAGQGAICA